MGMGGEDGAEGGHRREERRVFHQGLLSPLGMGSENIKWPQRLDCYRAVDETVTLNTEEKGKNEDQASLPA